MTAERARKLLMEVNTVGQICKALDVPFYNGIEGDDNFREAHTTMMFEAYRVLVDNGTLDQEVVFNVTQRGYDHMCANQLGDVAFLDDSVLVWIGNCWQYIKIIDL